jgi:LysM repeat protein
MKKLIILLFLSPLFVAAQTTHTVQPKETLYSLGREYNVHPKELAQYNNIPFDKGLVPGQIIKIPAAGKLPVFVNPAGTTTAKAKEETSVKAAPVKTQTIVKTETVPVSDVAGMTPVYHKVEKKETLYHISTLYNKVSIEDLKKWNHLTNDALAEGEDLIVGYTKAAKNTETVVTKQRYVEPTGKDIPKRNPPALPVVDVPNNNVVKTVTPKNGESETNFGAGFFKSFYSEQAAQKRRGRNF